MNRKINSRLIGMAVVAILVTAGAMTAIFYNIFRSQIRSDMRRTAKIIEKAEMPDEKSIARLNAGELGIRLTWIAEDGTVLLDNEADAAEMENHGDRPEVREALASGEGENVRASDTLGNSTYYYAVLLSDGTVLRVAEDARGLWSIFFSAAPVIAVILLLVIAASVLTAHFLTRQLIAPIRAVSESLDGGAPENTETYRELMPFLEKIRTQQERILEDSIMRQDFTANVSHELKTPLTAISGYAELIENRMVPEEKVPSTAAEIRKNAGRLLTLINDIIRLTELDHAREGGEFEMVDLDEIAGQCAENLRVSAEHAGLSFQYLGETARVRGNRDMIRDLIDNLGENAVRYNRRGGYVNIRVTGGEQPSILVEDNGIGIPEDQQSRVFERFYRVDKSRSRERGGTGLGLAIVKHVAALHHAEIRLKSREGEGTKVEVIFPGAGSEAGSLYGGAAAET